MRSVPFVLLVAAACVATACASIVSFPDVPDIAGGADGSVSDSTTEASGSSSGSDSGSSSGTDSGSGSGSDSGSSSGADSGSSSGADSGSSSGDDSGSSSGPDSGSGSGSDSGSGSGADSGSSSGPDSGSSSGADSGSSSGADSGSSSGVDSGADAGSDAGQGHCTPTGTGVLGVLGCSCSTPGQRACNGNDQNVPLLCSGGSWSNSGTCSAGQLCDSQSGSNAGTCQPIDSLCTSATPGQEVCANATTVTQCGPDLVTDTPVETCSQPSPNCSAGSCTCSSGNVTNGVCCPTGQTGCSGTCSNTATDSSNCGGCGTVCPTGATCQSSACVCPSGDTVCSGACVDLLTSNTDCGGCGLACSSGCKAGKCLVTLASGRMQPTSLATDSTNVYFTDASGVESVPVTGGPVTTIASIPANGIVQFGAFVYFITPSYVYQQAKTGSGNPTQLAALGGGGGGITTNANNLYWSDFKSGTIYDAPLAGGLKTLVSSAIASPLLLAVNGANAYASPGSGVYSVPLGGGTPVTTIAASNVPVNELTIAASGVYWTGGPVDDTIFQAPLGSTTATPLVNGQLKPWGIAVDAATIYWSNQGTAASGYADGSVASMPIGGSTPTTLAAAQRQPQGIVVDATSVYWVNDAGGTVMRLTPK